MKRPRLKGLRAVVNVTSDKCYENRAGSAGIKKTMPWVDTTILDSKACGATPPTGGRFSARRRGRAGFRAGRKRDRRRGLGGRSPCSRYDQGIAAGRPVEIRNPAAVRPWQHVLEPIHGYLLLAECLCRTPKALTGGWNFGPAESDARDVLWIVKRLAELWGPDAKWTLDEKEHPHEAAYLKLDASRAAAQLKWRPVLDLDAALQWIVDWHRAHRAGEAMDRFSEAQIAKYQERVVQ